MNRHDSSQRGAAIGVAGQAASDKAEAEQLSSCKTPEASGQGLALAAGSAVRALCVHDAAQQKNCIRVTLPASLRQERLDKALATLLQNREYKALFVEAGLGYPLSRERVKKLILSGAVLVGGELCQNPKLPVIGKGAGGAETLVQVTLPYSQMQAEAGELDIVYENAHFLVINKPAGLTVHPCASQMQGTLVHRLLHYFPVLGEQVASEREEAFEGTEDVPEQQFSRPGIVHRLDKDTSGLLVAALDSPARQFFAAAFAQRKVHKEYLALVQGVPKETGKRGVRAGEDGLTRLCAQQGIEHFPHSITVPLARDSKNKITMVADAKGKSAQTLWRTVYADPQQRFSLLQVCIITGRTHQIRAHMRHIGHPLLGDSLYGGSTERAARQMLHAWKLSFPAVDTCKEHMNCVEQKTEQEAVGADSAYHFCCPPPEDMMQCILSFPAPLQRLVLTGNIGSGKSTVLRLIAEMGIPIFQADQVVRELCQPGASGHYLLERRYGDRFIPSPSAPVDSKELFAAMQQDGRVRRDVEHLIHPLVFAALEVFWQEQVAQGQAFALAEIPLYFEVGARHGRVSDMVQGVPVQVIGVSCPQALRWQRLAERRNILEDVAATLESWQWDAERKMQACDYVLDNSQGQDVLAAQVQALMHTLRQQRQQKQVALQEHIAQLWRC